MTESFHLGRVGFARHNDDFRGRQELFRESRGPVAHDRVPVPLQIQEMTRVGILQKVVRFVDEDPVRQAGAVADLVQRRQDSADVLDLLGLRAMGEVDDDAAIGIPDRPQEIPWLRRRILAAEYRDSSFASPAMSTLRPRTASENSRPSSV